jgi:CheY-specific phosphatase CheX
VLSQDPLAELGGLSEEDLFALTAETWESVLSEPLYPAGPERWVEWAGEDHVGGAVEIEGAWDGAIFLDCPDALASHVAARMFALPVEDVDETMRADVMGELVNILGGLFKSAVGGRCVLSLPAVGTDADSMVLSRNEVAVIYLDTEVAPAVLRVYG